MFDSSSVPFDEAIQDCIEHNTKPHASNAQTKDQSINREYKMVTSDPILLDSAGGSSSRDNNEKILVQSEKESPAQTNNTLETSHEKSCKWCHEVLVKGDYENCCYSCDYKRNCRCKWCREIIAKSVVDYENCCYSCDWKRECRGYP